MHTPDISNLSHPLALYRNHLEFYGYRVEEEEGYILAYHSRRPSLLVRLVDDRGVLVSIVYGFAEDLGRPEMLEYLNELNRGLVFLKAYVDEDNNLVMEYFFEGEYDRTRFSILIDNVQGDFDLLMSHPQTDDYLE